MRALTKVPWLAASLLACLHTSWAIPASSSALSGDNLSYYNAIRHTPEFSLSTEKRQDRVALRILPFGASIMSGVGSLTKDGLRKYLRDALRLDGWEVNMVGSLSTGEMKDSNHEAVPGDIITKAQGRLRNSVGFKPNVVIINLGTNDAVLDVDVSRAGIRMESVLDEIWGAEGMADTCIILSTLIPNTAVVANRNRPGINNQFRALVDKRADEKCIYLADMAPNGEEWFIIDEDFLSSENPHTHPNDNGHKKMAAIFYQAINKAASDGKIVAAGDFEASEPFCDKFAGTGVDAGGKTQRGSGYDDDAYSHDSVEMPNTWTFDSQWDRHQWTFARLFSPDYDDLVAWVQTDYANSVVYAVWANSADGEGKFTKIDDMDSDNQCDQWGMRFIDMTGDGLDDFVCSRGGDNIKGAFTLLSVNQGDGDREKNKPPTFKIVGKNGDIIDKTADVDDIVLADIDGDGRGDFGIIHRGDDGISVEFWRNGGVGSPEYWQPLGTFFNSGDPKAILRFEDLNGDGRDDWLAMNEDGGVATNTNSRSCRKGVVGDGLNVAWRKGTLRGEQGLTHLGPPGAESSRVHFARIYGEASAFGNLPKQDYVYMQHSKVGNDHRFEMRVWKNLGKGGTKIRIDGNKYCNMMGHDDGSVDYVWAYQGGEMEMWSNRGKKTITDDDKDGFWDYQGIIWSPPRGMHRKDLHLADWDGDGDCDIIYVDPGNNAVEVWLNEGLQKGTWEWTHLSNPAPGVSCSETRGIGIHDLAVRFADLTGNSRADYLCIKPDGHVSAFLHLDDGSWENAGQIKSPEGKDRANLRWADVNGDGLDDMIWIEKFSGDSWVWYNGGRGSPDTGGGSSFYWRRQDEKAYVGLAAGSCIFYADLDGSGRADEHYVLGSFNNIARTSLSPSCGLSDVTGDDDVMDGDLPEPPSTSPTFCSAGTGPGDLKELCGYVCQYNNCISPCKCTDFGDVFTAAPPTFKPGTAAPGQPENVGELCAFACSRQYCPSSTCIAAEDSSSFCDSKLEEAKSWDNSGASILVDNYIASFGNDDWLRGMDVQYNLLSGYSALNCDDISTNVCPGPGENACSSWGSPSFWYVRQMVSNINSNFRHIHELLQNKAIVDLALVDQMAVDFKAAVPEKEGMENSLASLSAIFYIFGAVAGPAAPFFNLVGGTLSLSSALAPQPEDAVDLEKVTAVAKVYVTAVMDNANFHLEQLLPTFFGNGDLDHLEMLFDRLVASGLIGDDSTRTSLVGKVLDGGGMMVPVNDSVITGALTVGINNVIGSVLGHVLSGLHYRVIGALSDAGSEGARTYCEDKGGIYDEEIIGYFEPDETQREKDEEWSVTVPQNVKDIMEKSYSVDVHEMLKNVANCRNGKQASVDPTTIYIGPGKYPPCYFGLSYVLVDLARASPGQYGIYPGIKNIDDLPSWTLLTSDYWYPYSLS